MSVIVEKAEKYRCCNSCSGKGGGVFDITALMDVGSTKQGYQIALCRQCMKDLLNGIETALKEKDVVSSNKGFYIGDVCYVLSDDVYSDIWGDINRWRDGVIQVISSLSFAVGSTAYGDGSYFDDDGIEYGVDAGNIGLVPLELCKVGSDPADSGRLIECQGTATFECNDGVFDIELPNGKKVHIDTREVCWGDTEPF